MTKFFTRDNAIDKLNFLRSGDEFMLVAQNSYRQTTRFGTVAMDGNAVSTNYGWVSGSHYYDDLDLTYINVKFTDAERPYTTTNPNHSIYPRPWAHSSHAKEMHPGIFIGVSDFLGLFLEPDTYSRVYRDSLKTPEQLHPSLIPAPTPSPQAVELAKIEAEMARLQARLEVVRAEV